MTTITPIDKLNKCLKEMDTLSKVHLDYEKMTLQINFNCFNGGHYEDVTLSMIFEDPCFYHLPYSMEADFRVSEERLEDTQHKIPKKYLAPLWRVLTFHVDGLSEFYCCFTDMTWQVSGGGFVLNPHELKQPH